MAWLTGRYWYQAGPGCNVGFEGTRTGLFSTVQGTGSGRKVARTGDNHLNTPGAHLNITRIGDCAGGLGLDTLRAVVAITPTTTERIAVNENNGHNEAKNKASGRSLAEALSELNRELNVRKRCYGRWIDDGKMDRIDALDRYERLKAARDYLTEFGQKEGVIDANQQQDDDAKTPF